MKNSITKYIALSIFLFCCLGMAAQISVETELIKINNPTKGIKNGSPLVLSSEGDIAVLAPDNIDEIEKVNEISYYPNYENYGAGFAEGTYYKHNHRVYLGGLIKSINNQISVGDTIFILPPAYRPDKRILAKGHQDLATIRLNIETNGVVRILSPAQLISPDNYVSWISLEGIQFNREDMIGDFHQGGYIFYIADPPVDLTGDGIPNKGLIAAPHDQVRAEWGCLGTVTNASNEAVGFGKINTDSILVHCNTANIAARICDDLVLNGYDDWFLPSSDECTLMWQNLADSDGDGINTGPSDPNNIGGFENLIYTTSTEYLNDQANSVFSIIMSDGELGFEGKNFSLSLRAIRAY